jgi:hypothetical protein
MLKSNQLQAWGLVFGIAFTSFGILRVGGFPIDAPKPVALNPGLVQALQAQGWKINDKVQAQGRKNVSNAEGLIFVDRANPSSGDASESVSISLIPVRTRSSQQLGSDTIGPVFGADPGEKPRSLKIGNDQFLRFNDSQKREVASSCIAGAHASTAKEMVSRKTRSLSRTWLDRIKRSVGLQPLTDWSCLFITISVDQNSSNKVIADQEITRIWSRLKPLFHELQ